MVIKNTGGTKMKIGVDAGCLGIKDERLKVGVYNVVKNFLIELGKLDKDNKYLLYSFEEIDKNLIKEFGNNFRNIVVKPKKGWLKIWLPLRIFLDKPDIFLALNQSMPGSRFFGLWPQNDKAGRMKTIGFVYDIAFEEFPEMYIPESVPRMRQNTKKLVKEANSLICISEWTKKEIIRLYKVNVSKIQVEYPGVAKDLCACHPEFISGSDSVQVLRSRDTKDLGTRMTKKILNQVQHDKYLKKENYFLFVGALKKSKNIPTIIKAFSEFLKKAKEKYYLYIVGGDKWLDPEINQAITSLGLQDYIRVFGYVNDKTLLKLYKEAVAFVSPSLYEGFGITLLEAMSLSCPVIAGNNTAQKEVVGKAGLLVNSKEVNAIKNAMLSIVNNNNLRLSLIKKGLERSKLFSWNKFARGVYFRIKKESIDPEISNKWTNFFKVSNSG